MVTNLLDTLLSKERIFVVGSGGVGKTTLSAALAVAAAVERPINVLVVTVDPAKRLAGTLGVAALANSPRRVELPELAPKGELWAASVDMKSAWDDLVQQFSPDLTTSERILASPIYHNLSAKFIGSYDYAAVQVLAALTADERYDLVIVDTPPSRNALDFLDAPARLREFFSSPLLALLTLPRRITWLYHPSGNTNDARKIGLNDIVTVLSLSLDRERRATQLDLLGEGKRRPTKERCYLRWHGSGIAIGRFGCSNDQISIDPFYN